MPACAGLLDGGKIAQKLWPDLDGNHTFRVVKNEKKTNSRLILYTEFCVQNAGLNAKLGAKDALESC